MSSTWANEIAALKILSREDEFELALSYQRTQDPRAAHALVRSSLRYALKEAHRFRRVYGEQYQLEDLFQEGAQGLVRAVQTFDPTHGVRFLTYGVWWVRARLFLHIVSEASIVKRRRADVLMSKKIAAAAETIRKRGKTLSEEDMIAAVAAELSYAKSDLVDESLSAKGGTNEGPMRESKQDRLEDPAASPEENLIARERAVEVRAAAYACARNPRERYILEFRLLSYDQHTLDMVADRLRLSRERVRQIEDSLKDRIRETLTESEDT